ncbi:MAG TPA: cation:proton antiporter [Methylocystis sp.]|nr:cation:proton antiporter [Methylocystis sp.]
MIGSSTPPSYREALLFLAIAGIIAPLFHRLRVSPVLGFLLTGVALGPFALGRFARDVAFLEPLTITDVDHVAQVAEFGLVFLLFMIGLELSWERLARMRRLVFGLGLAQVFAATATLSALGHFWFGLAVAPAVVMGAALAMSSTGIVMPVLAETRRLNKPAGRAAFAVLLMQDLAVAPALLFISVLQHAKSGLSGLDIVWTFAPAFLALGALILGGRLLLRPLFHLVASAQSTELFMAACLLVVLGSGAAAAAAGLSMELGAFIAGMLLAETEFRREIEVTIAPFKGLLLGLFFVSIGAGLDLAALLRNPLPTLLYAAGLVTIKALLVIVLARLFRLAPPVAGEAALLLAPGGEFAFAQLTFAAAAGVLPPSYGADAMVVVTLSMFAIPWLARLGARVAQEAAPDRQAEYAHLAPEAEIAAGKVLIVGYGRVGALVGEMLKRHDIPTVAIDSAVEIVAARRNEGIDIYWGSATKRELLTACGVAQARALAVTITDAGAAVEVVRLAHEIRSDMTIVARARDAEHATRLYEAGATDAIPETIEASLQLAETVLVDIGVPMGFVIASIHGKRDEYREILKPKAESARERQLQRAALRSRLLARRRASPNGDLEPPS